jgi:Zn-dependent M28 family amino/carboxypeptidase
MGAGLASMVLLGALACEQIDDTSDPAGVARADQIAPTDPGGLKLTLDQLAEIGQKRVGTNGGHMAGDYMEKRLRAALAPLVQQGRGSVELEKFNFPLHDTTAAELEVKVETFGIPSTRQFRWLGKDNDPNGNGNYFDVFEASGSARVPEDTEIVFVGSGTEKELDASKSLLGRLAFKPVKGKVALIIRNPRFHRASQYRLLQKYGAVGMLYVSEAPDNLVQIGSIRHDWEPMGKIPAVTIGKKDGQRLIKDYFLPGVKLKVGKMMVQAHSEHAYGTDVVGKIIGKDPSHQIVIGGHYDSWYVGSTDNGGGAAGLVALAERMVQIYAKDKPPYSLVFVAYDGEEVGLYGGYDYPRRHQFEGPLAYLNLEMPTTHKDSKIYERGVASSNNPALTDAFKTARVAGLLNGLNPIAEFDSLWEGPDADQILSEVDSTVPYRLWIGLDFVSKQFGGLIPTDIQGVFRSGLPTLSTATSSDIYHTPADIPDNIDVAFLATSVDHFAAAIQELSRKAPTDILNANDPRDYDDSIWKAPQLDVKRRGAHGATVTARLTDTHGNAKANVKAYVSLFCDDFFEVGRGSGTTNGRGEVTIQAVPDQGLDVNFVGEAPTEASACGTGNQWVHLFAQKDDSDYPHIEQMRPLK